MKFGLFSIFPFLIVEISFNLVKGLAINNEEKNDCTKFYNFIRGDNKIYSLDECCSENSISCEDGHIIKLEGLNKNITKTVPEEIFNFPNLEVLNFNGYGIETIPASISNLKYLKELHLNNNIIKVLPDELFKLFNLEVLDFSYNQIEIIPFSISDLINLKTLYLNNNTIKILPDELFKLSKLKILDLRENEIETIPSSVNGLKNLNQLYLDHNKINNFPDELCNLPHLERLILNDNEIETLPPSINNLKKFEIYDLSNNKIKNLPEGFKLSHVDRKLIEGDDENSHKNDIRFLIYLYVGIIIITGICCLSIIFYCYKKYPKRRPFIICILVFAVVIITIKHIPALYI